MLPLSPQGAQKHKIVVYHIKVNLFRRKSATKFLCVKTFSSIVVRHSLAYLSSIHAQMVGGGRPHFSIFLHWLKLAVLPKKRFGDRKGGTIDTGNLSIELNLRYHMSDPCTKCEADWTKIVVAIVDENFVRTHRPVSYTHLTLPTKRIV